MEFQWINFLPANWVYALYLTLFHSLWIGLLMAVLIGIIVLSTKKSSSLLRYNLFAGLLAMFVLVMGCVLFNSFKTLNGLSLSANSNVSVQITGENLIAQIGNESSPLVYLNNLIGIWNNYAFQIVLVWLLILCVKIVQLFVGLKVVNTLKHTQVFDAGSYWKNKVATLSGQLGVKKGIQIFHSGLAKVPMVIGHFKPVILVPLGMLNNLTVAQVDAILSHELAHIKRRDYLVNIFQSLVEIFFFFNPAVLWLCKLIKEERENCCDDLALICTNNKEEYIRALISCQEFQLSTADYAMAMAGHKNQLLERINRMLFSKRSAFNRADKLALTAILISVVIFSMAFTGVKKKETKQAIRVAKNEQSANTKETPIKQIKKAIAVKPLTKNKDASISRHNPDSISTKKDTIQTKNKFSAIIKPVQKNDKDNYSVPVEVEVPIVIDAQLNTEENKKMSKSKSITRTDGRITSYAVYYGKDLREEIRDEMVRDGLINKNEKTKYILTNAEMRINGSKISTTIHQKYKNKYINKPDAQYLINI